MSSQRPPLSTILPPLILGTAAFNHQYNHSPHSLPTAAIIHRALAAGITAFDTSPYYGPAEVLLANALHTSSHPRSSYHILTKVGRVATDKFDYSPSWIRTSIARSLQRLGTDYLDVVYCHDVEFVTPAEVISAIRTLRDLRAAGTIRYVGISGYPTDVLVELSLLVLAETGEPLDVVMSYGHYTLQSTVLAQDHILGRLCAEAKVTCVLNGSPLGMGLLRSQGVPVGAMGDFHPAPQGLRLCCAEASVVCERDGHKKLESVALRFALEGWTRDGASGGTVVGGTVKMGISVAGVSYLHELEELLAIWKDVVEVVERRALEERVRAVFAGKWSDYSWPSPGEGYTRESKL